jgi:hypothetical protein
MAENYDQRIDGVLQVAGINHRDGEADAEDQRQAKAAEELTKVINEWWPRIGSFGKRRSTNRAAAGRMNRNFDDFDEDLPQNQQHTKKTTGSATFSRTISGCIRADVNGKTERVKKLSGFAVVPMRPAA